MKPDQERVRTLLAETITLLCKNGLNYKRQLKVEGLIGVTLDDDEVFIIHLNEVVEELTAVSKTVEHDGDERLQPGNSTTHRQSQKRTSFQVQSTRTVNGVEDSFPQDTLSSGLDSSNFESERKASPNSSSSHSRDFASKMVAVKSEPSDDLILIENYSPQMQVGVVDAGDEMRFSNNSKSSLTNDHRRFDRQGACKRTRLNEPYVNTLSSTDPNDTFEIGAKTEILESTQHLSVSRPPNLVMMDDNFVTPLCGPMMGEDFWTQGQQCSNLSPIDGQRFSTSTIPEIPWSTIRSQNGNNYLPTGALCRFGPRSRLPFNPTASLPGMHMSRRTRFSSEKTYVCQYAHCGKTFYQKYNLYRHQREKHGSLCP